MAGNCHRRAGRRRGRDGGRCQARLDITTGEETEQEEEDYSLKVGYCNGLAAEQKNNGVR